MKAHDVDRLGAIRYGLSEIKRIEIDEGELPDEEAQKVLGRLIKQADESIEQYKIGQRDDLVKSEEFKIAVWRNYLPKPLSEAELKEIVQGVVRELEQPNFGQVMPLVMKKVAGRASGQQVANLVKSSLV